MATATYQFKNPNGERTGRADGRGAPVGERGFINAQYIDARNRQFMEKPFPEAFPFRLTPILASAIAGQVYADGTLRGFPGCTQSGSSPAGRYGPRSVAHV